MLAAMMSGVLANAFGRKKVLMGCIIASFSSLVPLTILSALKHYQSSVYPAPNILFIYIYMMCFGAAIGPIVWIFISETVPASGVSLCSVTTWLYTILLSLIFPIIPIWICFLVFACCVLFGIYYI